MRKSLVFAMVIALLPILARAESPSPLFQTTFNLGGNIDQSRSMFIDSKNNILVNGFQALPIGSSDGDRPAVAKISSSGQLIWLHVDSTKSATSIQNEIAASADDKTFFGAGGLSSNNLFYVKGLDADRNEIWRNNTSGYAYLTTYGDTLISMVEGSNATCYLLNKGDGSKVRSFSLGIRLTRIAVRVHKNFMYFSGDDVVAGGETIGKISLDDGKLIWEKNFPLMAFSDCSVNNGGDIVCIAGSVNVPTSTPSGQVYLLANFLARLNPDDGSILWQYQWFSRETIETNYENGTYSVAISPKGKIVTGGAIQRGNAHDVSRTCYVKMFSADGDSLWEKRWDYPETPSDGLSQVTCVTFDGNGELLVLGFSVNNSAGNPPDILHIDKYHVDGVLGIPYLKFTPNDFRLEQNYPNPFNPATKIRFEVAKQGFVKLAVYDILGREVKLLVQETKSTGTYEVQFDASGLSSGTYFYRLNAGNSVETKRMLLMK